ncbi:MAG: glucose-1-phosphate thymidylyltransferase [Bacteroidetes bacterium]|nr:MAG: glucose-1-phosphate thymidylyltransferase [Bacteroidota bacterium]
MNYILFDDQRVREELLPLTFTRPVADIRFGISTMREKWERILGKKTSTLTEKYLSKKFPLIKKKEGNILINSSICPNEALLKQIHSLKPDQALVGKVKVIAMNLSLDNIENMEISDSSEISLEAQTVCINNIWDLFSKLDTTIVNDFEIITKGRKSQPISDTNRIIGNHKIFIEEGAKVEFAYLNATNGPIYLGKDSEILEGAVVKGPFALGENSSVRPLARIYGATSIGPHCKAGGEISNSLIFGYSNKVHDGFMGNSIIGEWCNLGAGTNTSNLKNTYDNVRIWNYAQETFVDTGLQFCGLIMGDHSKTSINTMLNTGTVVGVSSNLFGSGFPRQFVQSFMWGGFNGLRKYNFKKAMEVAAKVYARRGLEFDEVDKKIMHDINMMTI